jgi:hypothetical protein
VKQADADSKDPYAVHGIGIFAYETAILWHLPASRSGSFLCAWKAHASDVPHLESKES